MDQNPITILYYHVASIINDFKLPNHFYMVVIVHMLYCFNWADYKIDTAQIIESMIFFLNFPSIF